MGGWRWVACRREELGWVSALAGCSRAAVGFAAVSQCCFLVPMSVVPQPRLLADTYWPILATKSPPTEGLCHAPTPCSFTSKLIAVSGASLSSLPPQSILNAVFFRNV